MLYRLGGFGVGAVMAVIVAAGAGWFQDAAPAQAPTQLMAVADRPACAPAESPAPNPAGASARVVLPDGGAEQDRIQADGVMGVVRYAVFRPDAAGVVPLSGGPRPGAARGKGRPVGPVGFRT